MEDGPIETEARPGDLNEGILVLKIEKGELIRDTEMFGKMDPYCTIVFGKEKLKTKVHNNGGKYPVWGDRF